MSAAKAVREGARINLAKHELTRSWRLRGTGVVTSVSPTLVIVRTPGGGYLHVPVQTFRRR